MLSNLFTSHPKVRLLLIYAISIFFRVLFSLFPGSLVLGTTESFCIWLVAPWFCHQDPKPGLILFPGPQSSLYIFTFLNCHLLNTLSSVIVTWHKLSVLTLTMRKVFSPHFYRSRNWDTHTRTDTYMTTLCQVLCKVPGMESWEHRCPCLLELWHGGRGVICILYIYTHQFSSVAQSCPTFCYRMNRSMPGLPVHHQLPEFTQTHVHHVSDATQPSQPLLSPSLPAPNPSQHQSLLQWVNSWHEVAQVLEFQL